MIESLILSSLSDRHRGRQEVDRRQGQAGGLALVNRGLGRGVAGAEGTGLGDAHTEVVVVDVGDGASLDLEILQRMFDTNSLRRRHFGRFSYLSALVIAAPPPVEVYRVSPEVRREPRAVVGELFAENTQTLSVDGEPEIF